MKTFRKKYNLTQIQLAELLGVLQSSVSRMEQTGKITPRVTTALAIIGKALDAGIPLGQISQREIEFIPIPVMDGDDRKALTDLARIRMDTLTRQFSQ